MKSEKIVRYDTAMMAKLKGFNWKTSQCYIGGLLSAHGHITDYNIKQYKEDCCSAPTQSLLAKWLRDEHLIYVLPYPILFAHNGKEKESDEFFHSYKLIIKGINHCVGMDNNHEAFEEAFEVGLMDGLERVVYEQDEIKA